MATEQKWTVVEWDHIDGDILGALIVCVECLDSGDYCQMCDGSGRLHQPYRLPTGAPIDLARDAHELMAIAARYDDDQTPTDV